MINVGESKEKELLKKVIDFEANHKGDTIRQRSWEELGYANIWNGKPLVTKDIPEIEEDSDRYNNNAKRNNYTALEASVALQGHARIDDTERIAKLMTKQGGVKWLAHQVELETLQQNLADKRQTGDRSFWTKVKNIGSAALDGIALTTSVLAQVAVAGTGEHQTPYIDRAYLKAGGSGGFWSSLGQLTGLTSGNAVNGANQALAGQTINTTNPAYSLIKENVRSSSSLDQSGEAERVHIVKDVEYGRVNSSSYSRLSQVTEYYPMSSSNPLSVGSRPDSSLTTKLTDETSGLRYSGSAEEFEPSIASTGSRKQYSPDSKYYTGSIIYSGYGNGFGTVTEHTESLSNNTVTKPGSVGPWQATDALELKAATTDSKKAASAKDATSQRSPNDTLTATTFTRVDNGRIEMIPFEIRAVNPGALKDNCWLFFEANLSDYSDNYTADLDTAQYVGRADKFYTYTGFGREISFGFKMVAHSRSHLEPMYNRLNGLISTLTPTYSDVFMKGTLAEITIGDLLYKQQGFIKSVGLKWQTDYMWEINGQDSIRVPHVLDVSIGFTPIHSFIPQTRVRYFNLSGDSKKGEPTFVVNNGNIYRK